MASTSLKHRFWTLRQFSFSHAFIVIFSTRHRSYSTPPQQATQQPQPQQPQRWGGCWLGVGGPMCNWTQCTTNVLEFCFESIERCAKADVVLMQIGWSILPAGLGANGPPPGHIWEQFSVQCTPQGTRIVSTTDATKQESTWLELDGRLVQCKS